MATKASDRIPVIVGIGEVVDRLDDAGAKEPRTLIREAIGIADRDAGGGLAVRADRLDVIQVASFAYRDLPLLLAKDIGADPAHLAMTPVGGDMPLKALAETARAIADGTAQIALICGGEALRTRMKAAQERRPLGWQPADPDAPTRSGADYVTKLAARYRLTQPSQIYPLYENAARSSWGQTLAQAQAESAALWARLSAAAAENPYAWSRASLSAKTVKTVSADNRLIAFPYPKLMNALLGVNQSAAIIVTDRTTAQAAGIRDEHMVHIGGATRAVEPADFLARDRFDHAAAQDAVLEAVLRDNGIPAGDIDLFELYSCFPIVPKMARRVLGVGEDVEPSMTGGLTFFGGPANNYMTHAVAAAVRRLRARAGNTALLYGQGEFVTKHAAILLSSGARCAPPGLHDVQAEADSRRGPVPPLLESYEGPATLETFTVLFDRNGAPEWAPVVLQTANGERVLAVAENDGRTVVRLVDPHRDAIGACGHVRQDNEGFLRWSI